MPLPPSDACEPRLRLGRWPRPGAGAMLSKALAERLGRPVIHPEPRGAAVDHACARSSLGARGMLPEVERDVDERVAKLARRRQVTAVIPLAPEPSSPLRESIHCHRDARSEPLHPAREALAVVALREEVNMITLNRIMQDAKPLRRSARELRDDGPGDHSRAHRRHAAHRAHRDVCGHTRREGRPRAVRLQADVGRRGRASGAFTPTAPRFPHERLLSTASRPMASHIDSAEHNNR